MSPRHFNHTKAVFQTIVNTFVMLNYKITPNKSLLLQVQISHMGCFTPFSSSCASAVIHGMVSLVNVNAPVVATSSWWLHFSAQVVA